MKLHKLFTAVAFLFILTASAYSADWPWTIEDGAGGATFAVSPTNIDSISGNFTYTKWESEIAAYDANTLVLTHLINLAASGDSILIILQGRPVNWAGTSTFYWNCDSVWVTGSGDDNVVVQNTLSLSSYGGEYRLAITYTDAANGTNDEVDAEISIIGSQPDNINERRNFIKDYRR